MNTNSCSQLARFYKTPQGLIARDLIARKLVAHWPTLPDQNVLAFGFPQPWQPYLENLQCKNIILASADTGTSEPSCANQIICNHAHLPLANQCIHRTLLIHALDDCTDTHALLREVWRITTRKARILIATPNRSGLWTYTTPFAHYPNLHSRNRIETMLADAMFAPYKYSYALHAPTWLYRRGSFWDKPIRNLAPTTGSFILIEARKILCVSTQQQHSIKSPATQPAWRHTYKGTHIASLDNHETHKPTTMGKRITATLGRRPQKIIPPHRTL